MGKGAVADTIDHGLSFFVALCPTDPHRRSSPSVRKSSAERRHLAYLTEQPYGWVRGVLRGFPARISSIARST